MAQSKRVVNLTRGLHWKFNRAERAVYECACAWVEYGVSVRDLTWQESVKANDERKKLEAPLAYAELPGLIFTGPTNYTMIRAAHQFAAGV